MLLEFGRTVKGNRTYAATPAGLGLVRRGAVPGNPAINENRAQGILGHVVQQVGGAVLAGGGLLALRAVEAGRHQRTTG